MALRLASFVAVVCLVAAAMSAGGDASVPSSEKASEVIVLTNSVPSEMTALLALPLEVTAQPASCDPESGLYKAAAWYRTSSEKTLMPSGVDIIAPFDRDRSLVVYGTRDGIERLRSLVKMLDVAPKKVEIKAEVYRLTAVDAARIKLETGSGVTVLAAGEPAVLESLRGKLRSYLLSSPVCTTINNRHAQVFLAIPGGSDAKGEPAMDVRPRVNGDGTITLDFSFQISGEQVSSASRRLADGETVLAAIPAAAKDGEARLLLMITPTVLK